MITEIEVPTWVHRGNRYVHRDALDHDDPDHTYNYIKRHYNVDPEDFGIKHPLYVEFKELSRSELIERVIYAEAEVRAYQRAGF